MTKLTELGSRLSPFMPTEIALRVKVVNLTLGNLELDLHSKLNLPGRSGPVAQTQGGG
jgi:hypothetical protein